MKKILFISPLPPPNYGSAISSKTCLNILKESDEFQVRNIKLNYSKNVSDMGKINFDKIKGIFAVKKQIQKELKEFKPDLVYFMPATASFGLYRDYYMIKEIKKQGYPILFHLRTRTLGDKKIYGKMFGGEKVIILGNSLGKDIDNYIIPENIHVLPNAVKNEISDKEADKLIENKREGKLKILFLSNMKKSKGWENLLEACSVLKEKGIDFECNFVGDFENEDDYVYFKEFKRKNKLKFYVNYLGKQTGKEKSDILKYSDLLVFPTEYKLETFGRVIIEGMMYGLPVISNNIASIPEIIKDGITGYILKENTPEEIANKIEQFAKNKELCVDMGREGRKRFLENYELSKYKKDFKKILKNC